MLIGSFQIRKKFMSFHLTLKQVNLLEACSRINKVSILKKSLEYLTYYYPLLDFSSGNRNLFVS